MTACSCDYMRHWCLTSTAGKHVELALGGRAVKQTIHFACTQAVAQLSAKGGNCTANALLALTHGCGLQHEPQEVLQSRLKLQLTSHICLVYNQSTPAQ